jgi:hypothetical protein
MTHPGNSVFRIAVSVVARPSMIPTIIAGRRLIRLLFAGIPGRAEAATLAGQGRCPIT